MKLKPSIVPMGAVICVLTLFAACGGGKTSPDDSGIICSDDEDCPFGMACIDGVCQIPGGDEDTSCISDEDCPAGQICVSNHCVEPSDAGTDGGDEDVSAPDIEILSPPLTGDPPAYVLDFGSVMVGQVTSQTVRFSNVGAEDLQVVDLVKELGTVDDFYLDQATLDSLPIVVPPGEEAQFEVMYRASDGLNDYGVLSIISNDPDEARVPIQLQSTFKGTANIDAEPAELSFGDVPIGDAGRLGLTISNQGSGNAVLKIDGIQLANLVSDHFEIEDLPEFPLYLNRGGVLDISVAFHPVLVQSLQDRVVILSDDENDPQLEVPLSGRGVEPSLTVDPSPIDLGETPQGIPIATDVVLRNDGGAPLSITGIELVTESIEFDISSDPDSGFDLENLDDANPQLLQPGEERLLTIGYSPTDTGTDTGFLTIYSPDIDTSPREVAVQAEGYIPPIIGFDPTELDYGQVHVNGMLTLPLTVKNTGERFLEIFNIQVSGIDSYSFLPAALPNLGTEEEVVMQVTFAPLSTGQHNAGLVFDTNDPVRPEATVDLLGESIDPDIFVWPPQPIDFGQVYRATTNSKIVEVYVAGMGPLQVNAIELIPAGSEFSLHDLPVLPVIIPDSSQSESFRIEYTPMAIGDDSVALRIDSSDLDNPSLMITVIGEAVGCPAGWWDIDGDPDNGCEYSCNLTNNGTEACDWIDNDCDAETDEDFDLQNDPMHCGSCNSECTYSHADGICVEGDCALGSCHENYWDVNGHEDDGCEYACVISNNGDEACDNQDNDCDSLTDEDFDLSSDVENCGGCGNVCDLYNAVPACVDFECVVGSCVDGFDDCDLLADNGCETNLMTDPENCNGCGIVCSFPNAPAMCVDGGCLPGDCSSGFADCNGNPDDGCETNTNNDELNCGECGHTCDDPAEVCVDGECSCGAVGPDCEAWQTCCGIECVDAQTDENHCGGCNNVCQAGEECVDGGCSCGGTGPDCLEVEICCGEDCFDPLTSQVNCGECDNTCDTNELCTDGECRCGGLGPDCSDPLSCCGTSCVDLQTNEEHCGACNSPCELPHAMSNCTGGTCVIAGCETGFSDCNETDLDGCEINTDSDIANCGTCGNVCSNANGTTSCVLGNCIPVCSDLWGDCDGDPDNGCETAINTLSDCGDCGVLCSLPNASETCITGACEIDSCDQGYADCNSQPGCETNINQDVDNCGSCSNQCTNTHGSTQCNLGVCTPTCTGLWGDCDGDPDDGCETPLNTLANCGACGTSCSLPNADETCSTGSCEIDSCNSGFADCNTVDADGCEINTMSDIDNCGACGNTCSNVHGTTQCNAGVCDPTCAGLWGDCDSDPDDGCETALDSLTNCGACGAECNLDNASETCSTGTCEIVSCDAGYTDCNSNDADGCEINTAVDVNNCGTCGNTCTNNHGSTACNSGVCDPTCDSLWGDCDGDSDDGCETPLDSLSNCGACGVPCSLPHASETCSTGVCEIVSCEEGYTDCNSNDSDGCETNTAADVNNCGTCGNTCTNNHGSTQCTLGNCEATCDPLWGDCDGDPDDGCETPLNTLTNCGDCTTACSLPHADESCSTGSCEIVSCDAGYTDCNSADADGCEVHTAADIDNCGACGNMCTNNHGTTQCVSGVCDPTCDGLWGDCNANPDDGCETALNTLTDCGDCSVPCDLPGSNETCVTGTCEVTECDPGYSDCTADPGCETHTDSDINNCGTCGNVCSNPHGSTQCMNGVCSPTCVGLWGDCDGDPDNGCETPLDTLENCGSCGAACDLANASESCSTGTCQIVACDAGYADCNSTDADGCEINTTNDIGNCGGCGNTCTNNHGTTQCTAGVCNPACVGLWGECDSNPDNGCETALNTNTNCGSCGAACSLPNATESCSTGICQIVSCDAGFADCNSTAMDGCEINTISDVGNCGACGNTCTNSHGSTQCLAGVCDPTCVGLWGDCDSDPDDGCETPLNTLANCGVCGLGCSLPNASETCSTGTCEIASCDSGYADCNSIDADGCEINTSSDINNCGSCSNKCTNNHGSTQCTAGVCDPSCVGLWGDCDGDPDDGCETPLDTLANCGTCSVPCDLPHASENCSTGTCVLVSCNTGYGDCTGAPGCETNIHTDVNNCGACGNTCTNSHGSTQCSTGICDPTCVGLWGDCDGDPDDGCETPLNTLSNCGSCSSSCELPNANENCDTGSCLITSCISGWGDCNSVDSDGCEIYTDGDIDNCGGCGTVCSLAHADESCTSGNCVITVCESNWWDVNDVDGDGCECGDGSDVVGTCSDAVSIGTVSPSNTLITRNGVIVQRMSYREDQDCYKVSYSRASPGSGTFRMRLNPDPGTLKLVVWRNTCNTSVCNGDTLFTSVCSSSGGTCQTGNSNDFIVCVSPLGSGNLCQSYTLEFAYLP